MQPQPAFKDHEMLPTSTHILHELCEGLADSVLQKHHGLSVGKALHRPQQTFSDRLMDQRHGGGGVNVAVGESRDDGPGLHMNASAGKHGVQKADRHENTEER